MKTCTECGEAKPPAEFSKAAKQRDGRCSRCKACVKAYSAKWYAANTEKVKANGAKWYAAHPEKNKEYSAKRRADNPEKANAACAKWRAAHHEKVKASFAAYRIANLDKVKATFAKWAAANPEVCRIKCQNRRAREAGGKLTKGLAERLLKLQRGKCACGCGQPLGGDYHLDHRMPLALGGSNEDWNIQLLRKLCNLQKGAKHPSDFMQQRGFLL